MLHVCCMPWPWAWQPLDERIYPCHQSGSLIYQTNIQHLCWVPEKVQYILPQDVQPNKEMIMINDWFWWQIILGTAMTPNKFFKNHTRTLKETLISCSVHFSLKLYFMYKIHGMGKMEHENGRLVILREGCWQNGIDSHRSSKVNSAFTRYNAVAKWTAVATLWR